MKSSPSSNSRVDFVIITALAEERDAVLAKLSGYQQLPPTNDDIRTYFQADLPITFPDSSTGKYRVVVMCLLGMGRVQATMATADAIRQWHPRYIILIGIAGGIAARNVQIGDILISDQIVDYELQKLTSDGPEVRWDVQRADPRLLNAHNNFQGESWQELIKIKRPRRGKPNRHTGPIASGDKVITFSKILARYQDVWLKLLGVEMEAAGVATAAFQSSDRPGFFMVRGVSDLADENKGSSNVEKWRSYACDAAASFAIALLRSGPVPLLGETVQIKSKQVQLIFEGEFSEFTSIRQQEIVSVLATLLRIDQSDIRVLKVQQGSIVMVIEMPDSAANELYELTTTRNSRIMNLGIKSVLVEDRKLVEFADKIIEIPNNRTEQLLLPSIIALDGPASAGKSTIGMLLAGYLNYLFFDTGNMYRAVTLAVLQRQAQVTNEVEVSHIADIVKIDVMPVLFNDGRQSTIMLDGNDVTWDIRSSEVDANVSQVSAYSHVRQVLTAQMREIGKRGRVIMAGRDIGTVVLPNADLKLYLIASPEERARRRHVELEARGVKRSFEDILSSIRERDHFDSHREHAPLKPADDALIVDTTGLNIEQSATKLLSVVKSFKAVSV